MNISRYRQKISAAPLPKTSADWLFLRIDLDDCSLRPMDFLMRCESAESMIFSSQADGLSIAGAGIAARWDDMPPVLPSSKSGIRCFACLPFRFQKPVSDKWKGMPTGFFIPEFECHDDGTLYCNLVVPPKGSVETVVEHALTTLETLFRTPKDPREIPPTTGRTDIPTMVEWEKSVDTVLGLVETGELKKVVLARETEFRFARVPNPLSLVQHLIGRSSNAIVFMFRSGDTCFLGATPELLFTRTDRKISSHAIAATRSRGDTEEEDTALAAALLSNPKELHEHELVTDMIIAVLESFCTELDVSDLSVLKLPNVQHLYRGVEGTLKDHVTDNDVLANLHPTPAVGGTPRRASLNLLSELETFERGCYASPIGYVTRENAAFYVAIRSALLTGERLSVYAGAGIVPGSDAHAEWLEIEKKMVNFMSICDNE